MATNTAPLEATVKRNVERVLKQAGAYFIKATSDQAAGTPDLLCCYRGRFVAMELKRPGEQPTRIQAYRMAQVVEAGGFAFCVHSAEEARIALVQCSLEIDHTIPEELMRVTK